MTDRKLAAPNRLDPPLVGGGPCRRAATASPLTLRSPVFLQVAALLRAAVGLYATVATFALVAHLASPDGSSLLSLAGTFRFWWLLPAPLAFAGAIALRRRDLIVAAVPAAAVWLMAYGPFFLPATPGGAVAGQADITVVTLNMHGESIPDALFEEYLQQPWAGGQGARTPISSAAPDLVGLQETPQTRVALADRRLRDVFPYQAVHRSNMLLSRHPIVTAEPLVTNDPDRAHLQATVSLHGVTTQVVVAHAHAPRTVPLFWGEPGFGLGYSDLQLEDLAALGRLAENGPTLVLGDLNIADQVLLGRLVPSSRLRDTWPAGGFGIGSTWPARQVLQWPTPPVIRIDYVLHSPEFEAVEAVVGGQAGLGSPASRRAPQGERRQCSRGGRRRICSTLARRHPCWYTGQDKRRGLNRA